MLTLHLASALAFAAECSESVKAEQVGGHVEDAMLAYATLDEDGFRASAALADTSLPCVEDLFTPSRVAGFHRMKGLLSFIDGDAASAQKSFAAALTIEPDYTMSLKIAPEGGKLWRNYDGSRLLAREAPAEFPTPRGAKVYVDGTATNVRVGDLPAIVQVLEGTEATTTLYLAGGTPVPALSAVAVAAVEPDPNDLDAPEDGKGPKPEKTPKEGGGGKMWVGVGASAAVAAGLFATSAVSRSSFDNNPSAGSYYVTNGAYFGSLGAAALTVGLASVAIGGSF
jgi:hypothetical protein